MRTLVVIFFLLFSVVVTTQNSQAQGGDIQKLMQDLEQCMAKIDQAELAKLEQEGEKFEEELKALCLQGERDKAQKMAIEYSEEMKKNPVLVQMNACAKISEKMVPEGTMLDEEDEEDFDPSKDHACDELE